MIAEYIASIVAAAGFEPIQSRTLAEARSQLATQRFDLWLCDRNLPDGDSIDLLAERDRDARHRDTPAIALTAELSDTDRRALVAAGFADALAKPCTPDALRKAIDTALAAPSATTTRSTREADEGSAATDLPVLSDDRALAICGGDQSSLRAMRRLMAGEIPVLRERFRTLLRDGDYSGIGDELHKLAAAAAWCGADELTARANTLRSNLGSGNMPLIENAAARLDESLSRLALALRSQA